MYAERFSCKSCPLKIILRPPLHFSIDERSSLIKHAESTRKVLDTSNVAAPSDVYAAHVSPARPEPRMSFVAAVDDGGQWAGSARRMYGTTPSNVEAISLK